MRTLCDVCESAAAILFCAADEAALCRACDDKIMPNLMQNSGSAPECMDLIFHKPPSFLRRGLLYLFSCFLLWRLQSTDLSTTAKSRLFFLVVCPACAINPEPIATTINTTKGLKVHLCNKLASRHVRVGLADPSDVSRCDICENAPAFFYCEIDGSCLCLQCDMIVHVGGKRTHGRYLLFRQRVEFPGDKPSHLRDLALPSTIPVEGTKELIQPSEQTQRESPQNGRAPVLLAKHEDRMKMDNNMIDLNARPNRMHGQTSNNQVTNGLNGCYEESASTLPTGSLKGETKK